MGEQAEPQRGRDYMAPAPDPNGATQPARLDGVPRGRAPRAGNGAAPPGIEGDRAALATPPIGSTALAEVVTPSPAAATAIESAPAPRKRIFYGYYLVLGAFVAQFMSAGLQNYVVGPFLTPMTEELGWTRAEFQLARTIGQFVMAFVGFNIGALIDRRGGRPLMQGGGVILAVALFGTSFVQNQWQWILVNGVAVTVGAAMIGNLVVNVTLSKWFVEKRGRMVGFSSMGVSFAGVFLVPAATRLVDEVGWRTAWQVLAVGAIAIVMPLSLVMRRAPEDYGLHPDGKSALEVAAGAGRAAAFDFATSMTRQQALRTRSFYLIVLAYGLGVLSIGVMLAQTIPYMTDAGYSRTFGALMISLTSVPSMLTKPVWGYMVEKVDARKLSAIGFVLNAVAMVAIVFSVRAHATPFVYVSYFILGCGWGGLIPLQEVVWASFFGRRYLGSVRSAGLPFSLMIGASAPFLTALYFDRIGNYDGIFLGIAGAALVATFVILSARKPLRSEAVPASA